MRIFLLFAGLFFSSLLLGKAQAASLSDLAVDEWNKLQGTSNVRNPFVSGDILQNADPSSLRLEGVVIGHDLKLALVSGAIVREGDALGRFTVGNIELSHLVLKEEPQEYPIRIESYVPPLKKTKRNGFAIEFDRAQLKDALQLIAKAANMNMILPEDVAGTVSLSFEDIGLQEALGSILRTHGFDDAIEGNIVRVGHPDQFIGGIDLKTTTLALKYATAKDLVDKIKPLLSDKGSVVSDDRTNMITVRDHDANVANAETLLLSLDRKDPQVLIEAQIVDASSNFARDMGIRWGVTGTKGNVSISGAPEAGSISGSKDSLNVNLGAGNPTSGVGVLIGQVASAFNIQTQLTAAEQEGEIHIISKPSVTTLNNMAAKIRSGVKIYVKSTSNISIGTSGGASGSGGSSGLQEIDTGIELTVTPQITIDKFVKIKIDAVESEADFSRTVDGIPAIIDNTASTTIVIKNGDTAVIGGLLKVRNAETKRFVPGVGRIPVLGWLFKNKNKTKTHNELMIFITPRIVE